MIRAVIFDLDGTLADTIPLCVEAFRQAIFDVSGYSPADHEIIEHFGPSDRGVLARLLPESPELHSLAWQAFLTHYQELHRRMTPHAFPGAKALLERLRHEGITLAMVTGKCPETAHLSLQEFELESFFSVLETGNSEKVVKGECLLRIMKHLGLSPEDVIYIGDTVTDIQECRRIGVPIIAAAWASSTQPEVLCQHHPDYMCLTWDDFEEQLSSLLHG